MTPPVSIFAPVQIIVDLLKPVLVFFHDSVGVGWGMSIILLTVLIRALMAPLTVKQFKSMRAMAQVAPRLKELQAKYKDDKQRQQQEVMKFYQEEKINPFASCLPLVAQIPFFIGLFYLLRSDLRAEICGAAATVKGKVPPCGTSGHSTGAEQFLVIPDLTAPATGWVLAVLIVLYIGSQLLSSILMPSGGDRNTKIIMYGLPFVFTPIIIGFPAGLIVYWVTTNLWTVGQGYVLRKKLGPIMPPKAAGKDGDADEGGGGGLLSKIGGGGSLAAREPAPAASTAKSGPRRPAPATAKSGPGGGPPPPPPRKKKKRSGRRR